MIFWVSGGADRGALGVADGEGADDGEADGGGALAGTVETTLEGGGAAGAEGGLELEGTAG